MGFLDRLRPKRPPMTLDMTGTDPVLHAGASARVRVKIAGEDDGTCLGIRIYLRCLGWDAKGVSRWPLTEIPAPFSEQVVDVEVPTGLAPSCARFTEYAVCAELRRHEARSVHAAAYVGMLARDEDLYWPPERTAGDAFECDEATVLGGRLTGTVPVEAQIGPELDTSSGKAPRFEAVATVGPGAFDVELPAVAPPTLHDGHDTSIVWKVRAGESWRAFGVRDPDGTAAAREPALLTFLARLAGDRYSIR